MKNLFWAAVLIAVVPELVFLAADPAGVGINVGTAVELAGVGVTVAVRGTRTRSLSRRDGAFK